MPKVRGKTWTARAEEACAGCKKCEGNPPDEPEKGSEPSSDDQQIVEEIEDMIAWADAGFETDWTAYSFEKTKLYRYWRDCENEIERLHATRFQALIKGFMK